MVGIAKSCIQLSRATTLLLSIDCKHPMENKETGEICSNIIQIRSNAHIDNETGELERHGFSLNKPSFKIPFHAKNDNETIFRRPKPPRLDRPEICCKRKPQKYYILLAYITLSVILPQLALMLWIIAVSFYHIYLHRKQASGHPWVHGLFASHFCAICQSEKSMSLIGKLQDERTLKMRPYLKNIPIGS